MTENKDVSYGFYYIDRDYLEFLAKYDDRVPKHDYEDEGRAKKFYCGPVMNANGVNYYVPVSHQVKQMKLDNIENYGVPIKEPGQPATGCLDFRFMIPCTNADYLTSYEPKGFAVKQAEFCNKYKNYICKEAEATYNNILSGDYEFLNQTAIDDEKINDGMWAYEDLQETKQSQNTNETQVNEEPSASNQTETLSQDNVFDRRILKNSILTTTKETSDTNKNDTQENDDKSSTSNTLPDDTNRTPVD